MNNSIKIIVAAAVVVLLGVGGYYVLRQNTSAPATRTNTTNEPTQTSSNSDAKVAATITYTDSGFEPAVTTVKSGDTVKIVNNSSEELQMDSNPHPTHTDDVELNVGIVAQGQSKTFVLKTKGTWGFHNHLDPGNTAKVDVQ
jgi:plastocyanin